MANFKEGDRVEFIKSDYTGHPSRMVGGTGTVMFVGDTNEVRVDGGPTLDTWGFDDYELKLLSRQPTTEESETKLREPFYLFAMELVRGGNRPEYAINIARKLQEACE